MDLSEDELKMAAARSAVRLVADGMIVGLGSGSTATFAISSLGERVRDGLHIVGVPTSERSAAQARSAGIPMIELGDAPRVDMTINGADQVEETTLDLIKGLGGALLREKIVACASNRLIIVVHGSKLVRELATRGAVPIEVVQFGWQVTARHLIRIGCATHAPPSGGRLAVSDR